MLKIFIVLTVLGSRGVEIADTGEGDIKRDRRYWALLLRARWAKRSRIFHSRVWLVQHWMVKPISS